MIGAGMPILDTVFLIFSKPCVWASLNMCLAMAVGYELSAYHLSNRPSNTRQRHTYRVPGNETEPDYIPLLMCAQPHNSIQRPRQIPLLNIHLQQLRPSTRRKLLIETFLVRFFCFFLVVESKSEVGEDLPFRTCLAVGDVLGFEVCDFGSEDGPYP